jgi:hypothetical protein
VEGGYGPRRRGPGTAALVAALVVVVGAILRAAVLFTPLRAVNGDEAATGLMANRIARGHGSVFFVGQHYMGAAEQYLQAPVLAVLPGNWVALRLPDLALAAAAVALVYAVGARLLGGRERALAASAAFAVGPLFNLVYASRSMGAYNAALVVGLLALLVALQGTGACPVDLRRRGAILLGACVGAGFWLTPVSLFLTAPAVLWAAPGLVRSARVAAGLLAGLAVGSSPAWIWSLAHRTVGGIAGVAVESTPLDRARGLVDSVGPQALGLAWRGGAASVVPRPLWPAVLAVLAILWAAGVLIRRRGLADLALLRTGRRRPWDLVLVAVPLVAGLYLASPFTWWTGNPRYLYVAYPWLFWGLTALPLRGLPARLAGASLVAGSLTASIVAVPLATRDVPATWNDDLRSAASWLRTQGVEGAWADYRSAFTLAFLDRERLAAVPYDDQACRFPDLAARVASGGRTAWVLSAAAPPDLLPRLRAHRIRTELHLASVDAYVLADPSLQPWQVGAVDRPPGCLAADSPRAHPSGLPGGGLAPTARW